MNIAIIGTGAYGMALASVFIIINVKLKCGLIVKKKKYIT